MAFLAIIVTALRHRLPSAEARQVLRGPANRLSLAAAVLGLVAGSFLLLVTLQVVSDISPILQREFAASPGEYLVLSRKASALGLFGGGERGFTPAEVAEVRAQPFAGEVGVMTLSRFRARLTGTESIPFTTELFFEAVPDRFMDNLPANWQWREGDPAVPLIVSREFLALYNFGFAVAYRLPQLTPHTLQSLHLLIEIEGPAGVERFVARIAGFSDRYTSLLAPESFLHWANSRFAAAGDATADAARLVVRVPNPGDRHLATFLERKGYEANRERLKSSRLWNMVVALAGIAGLGGTIITGLAALVAVLSFQLTMTRCDREIVVLSHLGIAPAAIMNYFICRAALLVTCSTLVGMVLAFGGVVRFRALLAHSGVPGGAGFPLLLAVVTVLLIVAGLVVHGVLVYRHIRKLV
jgi:hypothetical protein